MRVEGKRAIVTGAGRNIGRAVALRFALEGASVGLVDLDEARGSQTRELIDKSVPGAATYMQCDVSSEDSVHSMVADTVDTLGGIDILVNCVAITDRGATVTDLALERWNLVIAVSLTSTFLCTKHVARQMVAQGTGGAIINIGSTSAHRGRQNVVAYGPAKAGVLNLSQNAAAQLGQYGIRVNTVTPNKIGSPVGKDNAPADRMGSPILGRRGEPEDVAAAVLYLASDEAAFVTATELLVDGGALYGASGG